MTSAAPRTMPGFEGELVCPGDPAYEERRRVCFTWLGDMADARDWLGVVRGLGMPVAERVAEMSYCERQRMSDELLAAGKRYYTKDLYLTAIPDAALEVFLSRGVAGGAGDPARLPDGGLLQWGGAIADVVDDEAAFSHRDAMVEWDTSARWTDPAEDGWRMAAARAYASAMEPFASGSYVNATADVDEAAVRRIYRPDKLARLQAVKRAWDPENVFHRNQNIAPGG